MAGPLAAAWPAITPALLATPTIPVPPASDRRAWAAVDIASLRRDDPGTPWPVPLASQYARYFRDGDRDEHEQVVWQRDRRVTRAAVLAAATLAPRWIDEVADGVTLLCEQSSWCWPAHDETFRRHGAVVPTVTDPTLDLGAGEVAAQLAWLDHLLGEQLDESYPGLRARIRHEVGIRVLTPFETRRDWHWLGLDGHVHNWSAWIHSNVLVAALLLVGDPVRRTRLVTLVVEGLDRYAASLPADGAIDEGYSYWWQGARRLFEALDLLTTATGGALSDAPLHALRETVAFPHRVHLGGDWYLNHADGQARPPRMQPWDALFRAARRVGDPAAAAHALSFRTAPDETIGLGQLLRALTDPDWADRGGGGRSSTTRPPGGVWFPSTQVLIARSARLTLAVKGGHNGENHNHNDVGSFVVALDGVPVLVDPGRPTYTAQTFGPRRYEIWTMQSSWHNTPTIRGAAQQAGRSSAARDVAVTGAAGTTPERAWTAGGSGAAKETVAGTGGMTLELAGAYPPGSALSWRRTAKLDHDVVSVRDSWELGAGGGATVVHLVVAGSVALGDGHAVIDGKLRVEWEPKVPCRLTPRPLGDPMLSDVWGASLTRMDLDVTALGPIGTLDLTVKEQQR